MANVPSFPKNKNETSQAERQGRFCSLRRLEHMARIILIIYFLWLSTWLMQNRVDLLNTKEYSHVLIVTTFKYDDLPKVYLNYVKKQMVIFRGIIMLVCQHSKSLTSQENHIYYLWGDIEKSDTGVTPEARQWLSQPIYTLFLSDFLFHFTILQLP